MPPQGTTGSIQGAKLSDPNGDRAERTRLEVEFAAHLGGARRHDQPASPVGALTELRPALEEALQTVTGLLGAERGIIALYESTTHELVTAASLGIPPSSPARLDRMPSPALESTAGKILGDDDITDDPRWAELVGTDASGTIRRVPLATSRGELMGTIVVSVPPAVRPSEQEAEIVRAYARQSAEVIERGRLSLQAKRQAAQLRLLADAAMALTAAPSVDTLVRAVTEAACEIIGTHQGATCRVMDGCTDAITFVRVSDKYAAWPLDDLPKNLDVLTSVTSENKPLRLTREQLMRHPEWQVLRDSPGRPPLPDYLAVPLIAHDGSNLGLIQLSDKIDGSPFSAEDEAILVQLAQMSSAAIETTELLDRERQARAAAEEIAQQRALLSDASRLFAGSLDLGEIVDSFVRIVVPRFADWCSVHLVDEWEDVRLAAVAHRDAEQERALRSFLQRVRVTTDQPCGAGKAIASGESQLMVESTDELLATFTDDPDDLRYILGLGIRAAVVVPLATQVQTTVGGIMMCRSTGTAYSEIEVALFEDLASRCAVAIERARLYGAEREAASTLQRSLLPQGLPMSSALTAAARYLPGARGAQVGGDWYDLIDLGEGRLGIAIGDVMGRGIAAAAVMGQLRTTARAYALEGHGPADLLERLDRVVQGVGLQLTTCIYAILDQHSQTLTVASAGHLPPLLIPASGEPRFIEVDPCVPLGVGGVAFEETCIELPAGSTLLLYTDGLVEDANDSLASGMERLRRAGRAVVQSPDELCDRVLEKLDRVGDHHDDIAVLAVTLARRPTFASAQGFTSLELAPESSSVATARHFVAAELSLRNLDRLVDVAVLLVSELVTNAVHHAGGPVRLQLAVDTDTVRVDVGDEVPDLPLAAPADGFAQGGRGLLIVEALASRWGVEAMLPGKRVWFELDLGDE